MDIDDFEDLENTVPGLPIPATPANVSLARNFVLSKWRERAAQKGRPEPFDLTDSCKFTSQFAMIVFGGYLQGNEKHQFIRLADGRILDLNKDAKDVRETIPQAGADPHAHDDEFFGNPEHEDSMASCRPAVIRWIEEFAGIVRKRSIHETVDADMVWNIARNVRNQIRVSDPKRLAGQCNWAAQSVAETLASKGIASELVRGRFGDHIHAWIEVGGLIVDPTVEQFVPRKQYVSNPGDLPYEGVERTQYGKKMQRLDMREAESPAQGQFVGVKFSPKTVQNIMEWSKANGIPGKENPAKFHTTIILNRDRKFPYQPIRWDPPLVIQPSTFRLELFRNNDVLVLRYESVELEQRHWLARVDHHLPWDYPEYIPHISLTNLDVPYTGTTDIPLPDFPLEIVCEYVTDFD